jgi:hypothetical protein
VLAALLAAAVSPAASRAGPADAGPETGPTKAPTIVAAPAPARAVRLAASGKLEVGKRAPPFGGFDL